MFPPGFDPAQAMKDAAAGQAEARKKTEEQLGLLRELRDLLQKILRALNGEDANG